MWMPQQQENKQQENQKSTNMVPVTDVSLNSIDYVQQEWQTQLPSSYGHYQQQQRQPSQQMQASYSNTPFNLPLQHQPNSWQTQPLQVPSPLPPQYAQQIPQPQISNSLYKKPLQQQYQHQSHQSHQQQQLQLQQQQIINQETNTYLQQHVQVPMYSPVTISNTEQTHDSSVNTDTMNNLSNSFATTVEQQPITNTNAPKLESFFETSKKKDGDGWDDWEWNDLNIHKESTDSIPMNPAFKSNLLQSFNQTQHLKQNQHDQLRPQIPQESQNSLQQYSDDVRNSEDENQKQILNFQLRPPLKDVVNDNWKWGAETSRENITKSFEKIENKSLETFNIEESSENKNKNNYYPSLSNVQPPVIQENNQSQVEEKQLKKQKFNNDPDLENTQSPLGTNPVYISQAKPVSQPSKQFASPPGQTASNSLAMQHPDISAIPPPQFSPEETDSLDEKSEDNKITQLPPPPLMHQSQNVSNPFKRNGPVQHTRVGILLPPPLKSNPAQQTLVSSQFFSPPPPEEFQNSKNYTSASNQENQEIITPENSEIINDNNKITEATSDRNRYMQISHLSEEGNEFISTNQYQSHQQGKLTESEEQNNDNDDFPPPGLSRLVLGQPENENRSLPPPPMLSVVQNISSNYIPPNFDRMVPGTELTSSSTLNLERQADGQDTIPTPISAFTNVQIGNADMDDEITSDRNLYQVPGKSENNENQQPQSFIQTLQSSNISTSMPQHQNERVVTGVEDNNLINQTNSEQRELELDGENLEDEQLQQLNNNKGFNSHKTEFDLPSSREEPIEGTNTQNFIARKPTNKATDIEINLTSGISDKHTLSLPSTANDESDERSDRLEGVRKSSRHLGDKKSKRSIENAVLNIDYEPVENKNLDHYYSEESEDNSTDNRHEKRNYREGSAKKSIEKYKSNRVEQKEKQNSGASGKYRDNGREFQNMKNERSEDERNKTERNNRKSNDRQRGNRYEREREYKNRKSDRDCDRDRERGYRHRHYDNDSRNETEGSRYIRGDSDQDTYGSGYRRDERDRRHKKRDEKDERGEYGTNESRRRDRKKEKGDDRADYKFGDRKDKHRRSKKDKGNRSDYDDDYRKGSSSRNASERERDTMRSNGRDKDRYSQMYGYSNVYGYDPYTYYQQQQQYYEQLRRNNPQAYMEWYNKYYSENSGQLHPEMLGAGAVSTITVATAANDRESVHSGRSSANNDKDRVDNMSLTIGDSVSLTQELHRLTPQKFNNEHSLASLSAGVIVCIKPKYNQKSGSKIVKIFKMGCNDSTRRLFQAFPGPLVRGITHKKTIIEFCEDQIRLGPPSLRKLHSRQNSMSSLNSISQSNKASFALMWNLLILLLRQNGVVIGTDIAELLIRNQKEYPNENNTDGSKRSLYKQNLNEFNKDRNSDHENVYDNSSKSERDTDTEYEENTGDDNLSKKMKNLKLSSVGHGKHLLTEDAITDKFRNYLLCGNINEALEWATNQNLWGHALFLASKVDRRLYANVMMKFANKLPFNDPLQTLYQLMSYKTPASVTSVQDEKWGDWRPHLAMILSNTSQRPDLDRKAITTLGDSLYNRGDYFGAHFCFLMAQVGFDTYSNAAKQHETSYMLNSQNAVRLVLLGSPFNKNFKEFALNEAIMMTEIYEYACSLNDEKFSISEFQPYKYLLATRMLDYGFQMKALMYMEQISMHIQLDPSKYDFSFIAKICDFADRLKFYDPTIEKTLDNLDPNDPKFAEVIDQFENQKWLQDLLNILGNYKSEMATHHSNFEGNSLHESNNLNECHNYEQQNDAMVEQFRAINQQFYELNSQYNNNNSCTDLIDNSQQLKQEQINNGNIGDKNTAYVGEYQQQPVQHQPQQQQAQTFLAYDPNILPRGQESSVFTNDNSQNVQQLQYQNQHPNQSLNSYALQENQLIGQQQQNFINNQNEYNYNSWDQSTNKIVSDEPLKDSKSKFTSEIEIVKTKSLNKSTITENTDYSLTKQIESHSFGRMPNDSDYCQKYLNSDILTITKLRLLDNKSGNEIDTTNPKLSKSFLQENVIKNVQPSPLFEKKSEKQPQQQQQCEKLRNVLESPPLTNKNLIQPKLHNLKEQQQQQKKHSCSQQLKQQRSIKEDVASPTISLPNTKLNQKQGYYGDDNSKSSGAPDISKQDNNKLKNLYKKDSKTSNKSSSQNSGWFEGIWNKLSLKPKNQMILPDDKNPSIVWDPERKRWVNTDGDQVESESFKPPPKMSDIRPSTAVTPPNNNEINYPELQLSQHQQLPQKQQEKQQIQQTYPGYDQNQTQFNSSVASYQEQQQPNIMSQKPIIENVLINSTESDNISESNQNLNISTTNLNSNASQNSESTTKVPNLQSNMFKMQRNRTLKKSYVDVFNPSGAPSPKPTEPILAPAMPTVVPQSGFFIPAPVDHYNEGQQQQEQQQQQQPEGAPQFYNPNQFGG